MSLITLKIHLFAAVFCTIYTKLDMHSACWPHSITMPVGRDDRTPTHAQECLHPSLASQDGQRPSPIRSPGKDAGTSKGAHGCQNVLQSKVLL